MSESIGWSSWFSRPVMGVLVIGVLVLLLAIPIALIREVIAGRLSAREEALAEVTAMWGGPQTIVGPRLVVPYRRSAEIGATETGLMNVLPATLEVRGTVTAEPLSRGLFTVPVYDADLELRGRFEERDWTSLGVSESDVLWDQAMLVVEVSDPRSVGAGSTARWNGQAVELLPGAAIPQPRGIHARISRPRDDEADFVISLQVKGSEGIWLVPFSRATSVSLSSNWAHPSFRGAWLPDERLVESDGFSAQWDIPFLGRDYPQAWVDTSDPHDLITASQFGAELISPVDHYRMSERSTKYAVLFLTLTFSLLWLFDTLVGVRVHPIQYLLVGAAVCMFYLLELSLSEHLGFVRAYGIAAFGVVALVAAYTKAVLGSTARGTVMAGSTASLYAYLFALLTLERYALLVGSLGLFSALATVMHLTRTVDWDRVGRPRAPAETGGTKAPDGGLPSWR
jgi:inner membrane protein